MTPLFKPIQSFPVQILKKPKKPVSASSYHWETLGDGHCRPGRHKLSPCHQPAVPPRWLLPQRMCVWDKVRQAAGDRGRDKDTLQQSGLWLKLWRTENAETPKFPLLPAYFSLPLFVPGKKKELVFERSLLFKQKCSSQSQSHLRLNPHIQHGILSKLFSMQSAVFCT